MLNIVTVFAIRKTSSLPKTLKTLLISLAVSDVGVGWFAHPIYTSGQLLTREQHYLSHLNYVPRLYSVICFSSVPECGRCKSRQVLSCSLHIRYQQIVTYKRDVASVISAWVSCAFVFALALLILHDAQTLITNIARGIGLEL